MFVKHFDGGLIRDCALVLAAMDVVDCSLHCIYLLSSGVSQIHTEPHAAVVVVIVVVVAAGSHIFLLKTEILHLIARHIFTPTMQRPSRGPTEGVKHCGIEFLAGCGCSLNQVIAKSIGDYYAYLIKATYI